ncbi:hypothetical protein C8D77_12010 [Mesorhizobium loti]|uniref:Uncharacterized protein n=1 Tax=Rhizobium loti TaxID=381 RepID=A0A8E3B1N0_RHILI|nr:hypothetical protein C8D77_12010 [Mesorhizobium loti]
MTTARTIDGFGGGYRFEQIALTAIFVLNVSVGQLVTEAYAQQHMTIKVEARYGTEREKATVGYAHFNNNWAPTVDSFNPTKQWQLCTRDFRLRRYGEIKSALATCKALAPPHSDMHEDVVCANPERPARAIRERVHQVCSAPDPSFPTPSTSTHNSAGGAREKVRKASMSPSQICPVNIFVLVQSLEAAAAADSVSKSEGCLKPQSRPSTRPAHKTIHQPPPAFLTAGF